MPLVYMRCGDLMWSKTILQQRDDGILTTAYHNTIECDNVKGNHPEIENAWRRPIDFAETASATVRRMFLQVARLNQLFDPQTEQVDVRYDRT